MIEMDSNSKSSFSSFADILRGRRSSNDTIWATRSVNLQKVFNTFRSKTDPETLIWNVLNGPEMEKIIDEVSEEQKVSKERIKLKVLDILEEVGYTKNLYVIRLLAFLLMKILKRTLDSLNINEEKIKQMRTEWGNMPVVFLPTHKSYGDFILMALVSFVYELEIPCVAAGMDFQSMKFMGSVLRDCSAFFMRRSYGSDQLYWKVFDMYVQYLVQNSTAPIEFFIEGTRSRTGKSLHPKLGLLSMVITPLLENKIDNMMIVPVCISYDRFLEEQLFPCELLGVPKPKESTSGLFSAINKLNEQYGRIYIDFGTPIYLKEFFCDVNVSVHTNLAQYLAHEVLKRQQDCCILSLFNVLCVLITHQLLNNSSPELWLNRDTKLSKTKASELLSWLSNILTTFGVLVDIPSDGVISALNESLRVHKTLVSISRVHKTLELVPSSVSFNNIKPEKLKGHSLEPFTMEHSLPLICLQNYVNPCLQFLFCPALISILLSIGNSNRRSLSEMLYNYECTKDYLLQKYILLRQIFSHEFIFYLPLAENNFVSTLKHLESLKIIQVSDDKITLLKSDDSKQLLCSIFSSILYPYFFGYHLIYTILLKQVEKENIISEEILKKTVQCEVEKALYSKEGQLFHPYPLSMDMISCCMDSLVYEMKVVVKNRRDGVVYYEINKTLLSPLLDELNVILNAILNSISNNKKKNLKSNL